MKLFFRKNSNDYSKNRYYKTLRKRLKNKKFTIISNNCVGGVIYHNLDCRFDSPTINLFMRSDEFLSFIKELKYYVHCPILEKHLDGVDYPVGVITPNDELHSPVTIYFQHYSSFDEAVAKWQERCLRIHWDNIYYIWEHYDNLYPIEPVIEFDRLPIRKMVLTHRYISEIHNQFVLPCYMEQYQVGLAFKKKKDSDVLNLDDWDYVSFLNSHD